MLAVPLMKRPRSRALLSLYLGLVVGILASACASQASHSRLETSHGQLRSSFSTTEADLKRVDGRLLLLEQTVAEQRRLIDALTRQLAEQEPLLQQLVEKSGSLSETNARLLEERSQLRSSLSDLQKELRTLSSSKKAAEARAAEKQAVLERFEAIVDALD